MAEADLHLKLDRLLAGQERILARQDAHEQALAAVAAGLQARDEAMDAVRELLSRLVEEATDEGQNGGEMRDLLLKLERHLAQIVADGTRMVTVINGLPRAMSDAAMDAVRLAMGDALDAPRA